MRFVIDYDIIKKIKRANEGITSWESYIEAIKFFPALYLQQFCFSIWALTDLGKSEVFKNSGNLLLIETILFFLQYGICAYNVKRRKTEIMNDASCDLNKLVSNLYDLEIETSEELLKRSTVIQTKYKLTYKDDCCKIPKLKQEKYINVPLTNGYEGTILQEHVFGDKNYEISVQSPVKKYKFKLALASS